MSLSLLFILTFLNAIIGNFGHYEPYDYCDPNLKLCPVPRSHTMCRYPVPGLSKDCIPFISKPLTAAEKFNILSLHNKLRSRVAMGDEKTNLGTLPSASNMLQMHWDEELETIADRWASRCLNVTVRKTHDVCRNTKRFRVTQNIGTIGSKNAVTEKKVIQIFYHWYIKSKSFNPLMINAYVDDINKTSEEFVNMVWADTYALGCASVMFRNNLTDSQDGHRTAPWTFERIVCNYGPGGIIPGKPVYKIGLPCTKCPSGWACSDKYLGLCILNAEKLKSSIKKSTKGTIDINETKMSRTSFIGVSSTFRYPYISSSKVQSLATGSSLQEWIIKSAANKIKKYNFKLKVGTYYNGVCHCPDITRHGFEKTKKHPVHLTDKMKKIKSYLTRSIGNLLLQNDIGKVVLELKNGDRCYCKTSKSNADDLYKPSIPCLIISFMIKLLIY